MFIYIEINLFVVGIFVLILIGTILKCDAVTVSYSYKPDGVHVVVSKGKVKCILFLSLLIMSLFKIRIGRKG